MAELKPCPFCGGEARFYQTAVGTVDSNSAELRFQIRCKECGAVAPGSYGGICFTLKLNGEMNVWRDDRPTAVDAWNRRVTE